MCVIDITLNSTVPNGTFITSAEGEYKILPSGNWVPFNITDLSAPTTPFIPILGDYQLRVKISNNLGQQSPWSNISTFSVSTNCGGDDIVLEKECSTNCISSWQISVFVPSGESRYLTIQKTGLATYSSSAFIDNYNCTGTAFSGVLLTNDISNDVLEYGPFTETTSFKFGLDASEGSSSTSSILTVRTYDGSINPNNNLDAVNYSRSHGLNNTGTAVIHC